ncbi:hypothetical protein scyTo_0010825 [Scyliorhinus torazame]|uniref:Uncharacterized protein n=1 Tax=Scyliorhinus torazame TaxID=75743 RepID=A0A401PC01_SCYTO|nr:hypothetical protein [Scyliorhinus torazame]
MAVATSTMEKRVVDFYLNKNRVIGGTIFPHKGIHKGFIIELRNCFSVLANADEEDQDTVEKKWSNITEAYTETAGKVIGFRHKKWLTRARWKKKEEDRSNHTMPVKDKHGGVITTEKEQVAKWVQCFEEALNQPEPDEPANSPASDDIGGMDTSPPIETEIPAALKAVKKTELTHCRQSC